MGAIVSKRSIYNIFKSMFAQHLTLKNMKKNTLTILAAIFMATTLFAQTVTTFTQGSPDDAIAIDSNGNIYCSNYMGDTVFKFTPEGDATSFVTGLNTPNGLAFNSNEELYVCDGLGDTIFRYDIDGTLIDSYATASHPSGIIKSFTNDDMIFTEYQGNEINILAPDGTITNLSSAPELNGPVGLAYDPNGVLYVGNYTDREIYKVLENGDVEYIATVPTDGGPMPNLGFIAFGQGYLWGTTMGSDKIYRINPNGIDDFILFAGSTQGSMDGDISEATFNTTNGILFNDAEDTMYITDFGTKNLRIISNIVLEVGEENIDSKNLILFPNPANINLNIKTDVNGDYQIEIYTILGKTVYSMDEKFESNVISKRIDISSLESGVYLVKVTSQNVTSVKRFIKK